MNKFAVFSGFLGSGKTTTMMALTDYYSGHCGKAAMISNDLGHGVDLADDRFAKLSGCDASAMTETCICYQNENLAERLNSYYDNGYDLVISDIPGFGVGALEHVYQGLNEKFPGQFDLAPFTVLVEPETIRIMKEKTGGDLQYIYHTQLFEADLIVLNKCDLIDDALKAECVSWLEDNYPLAKTLTISAMNREGIDKLAEALEKGSASMRRPDIGYGGPEFAAAMGKMTEYYIQYQAIVCCNDFDGTAYLQELAEAVCEKIKIAGCGIPHLKLLAWEPEGDYAKVDLIGADRPIETVHAFTKRCTDIAVVLNASAEAPAAEFEQLMTETIREISERYQLELTIFKQECFGMGG